MILGFMQNFPWKVNGEKQPTYFREKILAGARKFIHSSNGQNKVIDVDLLNRSAEFSGLPKTILETIPKIHTMRNDPHDRWKAGRSIQMVYRGPNYSILDHFNKGIPELERCVSTQKVKIWVTANRGCTEETKDQLTIKVHAIVDGKRLEDPDQLVRNDGFEDAIQFVKWFKNPIELKLIHWTDFRY